MLAERDFKGVWIPKEIWLDERLNALEKVILVEIDSLDHGAPDYCWKSNENLAEFCQCSATKVSNAVSKLIELGYIVVAAFDGRTRRLHSCIAFSARQTHKNCKADSQNLQASNTYSNTSTKNTSYDNTSYSHTPYSLGKQTKTKRFSPPSVDEIREYITEMDYPVDPERFFDYYESRGWMAGKNKMKDWKAAVRLWVRNRRESVAEKPAPPKPKYTRPRGEYGPSDGDYWNGMDRGQYYAAKTIGHLDDGTEIWVFPDGRKYNTVTREFYFDD